MSAECTFFGGRAHLAGGGGADAQLVLLLPDLQARVVLAPRSNYSNVRREIMRWIKKGTEQRGTNHDCN